MEDNGWEASIRKYLDQKVPGDWERMEKDERRIWLNGRKVQTPADKETATWPMNRVCIAQIWEECFGYNIVELNHRPQDRKMISQIMNRMPGWRYLKTPRNLGAAYGVQRCYERIPKALENL